MLEVAVGSFNFGMDQDMLRSRKQKTVDKHCRNFGRVCGKLVEEGMNEEMSSKPKRARKNTTYFAPQEQDCSI